MANERIPSERFSPNNETVLKNLGHLGELAGTWHGTGFNLIARPDFADQTNLYLELNLTHETLKFDPIGSPIPNRGFGQGDINLFGLTYLQKISDAITGGALHIEPGIWITQPETDYPPEKAPVGEQIVARMGTIPHGNSLLAQGTAVPFNGNPILASGAVQYAFSLFPAFNSTPFATLPTAPPILNAAGSSEALTAPKVPAVPFPQYDLAVAIGGTTAPNAGIPGAPNTRTPYPDLVAPLPPEITQAVVNDPITILQSVINKQVAEGYTFHGIALNIATQAEITFFQNPDSAPTDPTTAVTVPFGAGGIANTPFLDGSNPAGPPGKVGPNADTALVYATFWLEHVHHAHRPSFMQLQYAQMVVLNFEIFSLDAQAPPVNVTLGWPHITVATLKKTFD